MKKSLTLRGSILTFAGMLLTCLSLTQLSGQIVPLPAGQAGGSSYDGVTFELSSSQKVRIYRFWTYLQSGPADVSVYYRPNGHIDYDDGNWILIGTVPVDGATGVMKQIPLDINLTLQPGDTVGFYLTNAYAAQPALETTDGLGNTTFSDGVLTMNADGFAGDSHFLFFFDPVNFNGKVDYYRNVVPNEAGVVSIDSVTAVCEGANDVFATVRNYGSNVLNSLNINWAINGSLQTPASLPFALDTLGGMGASSVSVQLGSSNFTKGVNYDIQVWTSLPNLVADTVNANDTLSTTVSPSLDGTFTIGGASPDFSTFADAITELETFGVCGPVTFLVRNGTYSEQVVISEIEGASAANPIVFRSQAGDSTQVTITYASTGLFDNQTVQLDGADWVTFQDMTIRNTGTTYGTAVRISAESSHNQFLNNQIQSPVISAPDSRFLVVSLYGPGFNGQPGDSANVFRHNYIAGGSTGIYASGNSQFEALGYVQIEQNRFEDQAAGAISILYARSPQIRNNFISGTNVFDRYQGILVLETAGRPEISGNEMQIISGGYGMVLDQLSGVPGGMDVFNNMIRVSGQDYGYGIRLTDCNSLGIGYNTVKIEGTATNRSRPLDIASGFDLEVLNNIFVNEGGGYAFVMDDFSALSTSDHNCFFTTGNYFAEGQLIRFLSLNSFQNVASLDSNSLNVEPGFLSDTDLHVQNILLHAAGTPITGIATDFDGQLRDPVNPDIGADEFTPAADDAAIAGLVFPDGPFAPGIADVRVALLNNGLQALTSATLNWEVNGVAQSQVNWTGNLNSADSTSVTLGSFNFVLGQAYTLKAWTSQPNGNTDPNALNDTLLRADLYAGLGGIFTIGGSSPDFVDFSAAAAQLGNGGVYAPVTFRVRNGTYNEQVSIPEFEGASAQNPVVFESESGDSSQVVLAFAGTASDNYTLKFDATSHVTFQHLTLRALDPTNGRVIDIRDGCSHLTFANNSLEGIVATGTSDALAVVYATAASDNQANEFISFSGNRISGGAFGLYIYGRHLSRPEGLEVSGNRFFNQYFIGIDLRDLEAPVISQNEIRSTNPSNSYYGMRIDDCDSAFQITGNLLPNNGGTYGIFVKDGDASAAQPGLIANNMITMSKTGSVFGFQIQTVDHVGIYFNNVLITQGSGFSRNAYLRSGSGIDLKTMCFPTRDLALPFIPTPPPISWTVTIMTYSQTEPIWLIGQETGPTLPRGSRFPVLI